MLSQVKQQLHYKDCGVNIDEGNALVREIKPLAASTFDENVIGGIGSFAGAYALPSGYKNPVILGATDGVGTKLRLAIDSNSLSSIGIDLVAMCVNDLICNFAAPLFFLDYYATGVLEKHRAVKVIKGIVEGCKIANCALIGGESAEMPSMYKEKDFDLAGFAVGIAEREEIERESSVKAGDVLVGLESSGLHSNGFALARKICFDVLGFSFDTPIGSKSLIQTLLTPTNIYVKAFRENKPLIKSLAHITGGGLIENIPRALPKTLGAEIETSLIPSQEIFNILSEHTKKNESYRVFNMGIGMVFIISSDNVKQILRNTGGVVIGEVTNNGEIKLV